MLPAAMGFTYHRTIHFPDTDAAGVVFFPAYLAICHEAYEEALAAAGLEVARFFSGSGGVVVPISRSEADYLRPLRVGDKIAVTLRPSRLDAHRFGIDYEMVRLGPAEKRCARVRTEHICLSAATREREPLPPELALWVDGR
jgi:1,4-dihydroxy-2-naphthoyl-CoA hydrolase